MSSMNSGKGIKRSAPKSEGDRSRQRRRRTAFTDEQLDRLEESFANERFPGIKIRENLAGELKIGEDRIQVWFQNRRARWRKHEIKNKPAPVATASEMHLDNRDFSARTMFQASSAIIPHSPLTQTSFTPWSPFYHPFTTSASWFPPGGLLGLEYSNMSCAASQDSSKTFVPNPRGYVPTHLSSRPIPSPDSSVTSKPKLHSSSDSDSDGGRHSVDDYQAAATLASFFQREN